MSGGPSSSGLQARWHGPRTRMRSHRLRSGSLDFWVPRRRSLRCPASGLKNMGVEPGHTEVGRRSNDRRKPTLELKSVPQPGSPSSAALNQPERASVELGGKRK